MNWKFWRRQIKESRTHALIASMYGSGVSWSKRDYENFAKESYLKNIVAFRCIDIIAKSVSSAPWKLFKKLSDGEREEIKEHPFLKILTRAAPEESWCFLIYEFISYLLIAGNSFMERISPQSGKNKNIPKELYVLRPDRMEILINEETGKIKGYKYTIAGRSYIFEIDLINGISDILHLRLFHPLDDFWGAAITEPAAREIDTSNSATAWNKKLLDNEARPGMLLMFKDLLGDKEFEKIKKQIRENREGAEHAGKSLILEGAADAKPYGFSPAEMDFIQGNLELARRICMAWGVPAQMIGIPDTTTYSNYREARASFWEETVIFYLGLLKGELNNWFFKEENIELDYILDDIPALAYKIEMKWERAQKSDFLTINEKRGLVGLDEYKGGDVVLVPATMLPLGTEEESENVIEEEDEKAILKLIEEGYSREEAEEMIGNAY